MDDWRLEAECRGSDPMLFFPHAGEATAAPLAVCAVCEVRDECLAAHLYEEQGIWGGTTALGRRRLRRERRMAS